MKSKDKGSLRGGSWRCENSKIGVSIQTNKQTENNEVIMKWIAMRKQPLDILLQLIKTRLLIYVFHCCSSSQSC